MLDDMPALATSVCLLALSRSGRQVFCFAALCRADCALLCYAWVRCSTTTCSYIKRPTKTKVWKKKALLLKKNEQKENARQHVIENCVVQVGALRGQRGVNGTRWVRKTKIRKSIPAPHTFLNSFGREPYYGWSAIGAERSILIPSTLYS